MRRAASFAMQVGWPAFLMACVLELLVFSLVDPTQLHGPDGTPLGLDATAVYSIAFFVFWVVTATASGLSLLLAQPAEEINSRTFSR